MKFAIFDVIGKRGDIGDDDALAALRALIDKPAMVNSRDVLEHGFTYLPVQWAQELRHLAEVEPFQREFLSHIARIAEQCQSIAIVSHAETE